MADLRTTITPGTRGAFGPRYQIIERLGEGGTGTVFRAYDFTDKREVALKVLHRPEPAVPPKAGEPPEQDLQKLIDDEFRVLSSLSHPNLAEVYDYGVTPEGTRYFTMELLSGKDLLSFAGELASGAAADGGARAGAMAVNPVFQELVGQILNALDYIHTRRVLHEDLKPSNILVEVRADAGDGAGAPKARHVIKLIDFGLSRALGASRLETSGTVEYMAPEKLRGEPAEARSDLYSLGIVLHELMTGSCPFSSSSPGEVVHGHLNRPPPAGALAQMPPAYRRVVEHLLAKVPAERPASAFEVMTEIFGKESSASLAPPAFSAAFVGRAEVLERLIGAGGSSRDGRGAVFLIKGETGVGKSSLLRELQVQLQLLRARVAQGYCYPEGRRAGDILTRVLRNIIIEIGFQSPILQPFSAAIMELALEGRAWSRGREKEAARVDLSQEIAEKERLFHQAAEFLLAVAQHLPLSILVDDIQWMDTVSLEFFLYLMRRMRQRERCQIALFLVCRDEEDEDRRVIRAIEEQAGQHADFQPLQLQGLDAPAIRQYLAQVLGREDAFPEELPAALKKDTGGNPFFIAELLKLLFESGGMVREKRSWRILPQKALAASPTVQEVIGRRLQRIAGLPRQVLEWAAILAEPFTPAGVLHLLEGSPRLDELEKALGELVLGQILARLGSSYQLIHNRIGAVLYDQIPPPERRKRHRRIAERFIAEGNLDQERRLEQVANHLFLSDCPENSREYLLKAGARAQNSGALREAVTHLGRALEVTAEAAERFRIIIQREQLLGLLGDRKRQEEDLRELKAIASATRDASCLADAIIRQAIYLDNLGKKREALQCYDEAMPFVAQAGDPKRETRVLSRRGMAHVFLFEFEKGLDFLLAAREMARRAGDLSQEAECCQMVGVAFYLRGDYDKALIDLERALSIRRSLKEEHRAGSLESNIGLVHFDRGDLEIAEERFRSSLKIFRRIGFRRGEADSLVNLGLALTELGQFEGALNFIEEALAIRRDLGDRWGEGTTMGNLGTAYLHLGAFEKARPLLDEALKIARQFGNMGSEGINECKLGQIELHQGQAAKAMERFEKGQSLGETSHLRFLRLLSRTLLARGYLAGQQAGEAARHAEEALAIAREARMATWIIECQTLLGQACLKLDRIPDAAAASQQALEALQPINRSRLSQEVWFHHYLALAALQNSPAASGSAPRSGRDILEGLKKARQLLTEKAESIGDTALRRSFLENIPLHGAILETHRLAVLDEGRFTAKRERSFYDISRTINSIQELEPLLDRLLDLAVETTGAEKGLILLGKPGEDMVVKAARGMARESVADAAAICRSVIADVSQRGEPILSADASADERFRERRSIVSFNIRTLMCVPLAIRGERSGAVYVDSRATAAFTREDLDYLVAFADLAAIAIENARLLDQLRKENLFLRKEVATRLQFDNIIGSSAAMQKIFALVEKVAATSASVILAGETGTGKEVVARAIHFRSARKDRPFIAVDCGALPEQLLESELFGHKRGSFTGATQDRAGLFEEAHGGTVFLDEITNTSLNLQAKLLRVLQEGEIRRLGENQPRKVEIRVIAATNLKIDEEVRAGRFREDLFYRLNVMKIDLPSLRERREDIPLLALYFLKKIGKRLEKEMQGFTREAMSILENAPWPGNVRQLEHAIERAIILADKKRLDGEALAFLQGEAPQAVLSISVPRMASPAELEGAGDPGAAPRGFSGLTLKDFDAWSHGTEKAYLRYLVQEAKGNLAQAARLAKVRNRNTLIARLKRHGLGREGDD